MRSEAFPLARARPALAGDARAIAAFHTAGWRDAYRDFLPSLDLDDADVEDRERRWRERITTGARKVLLAEAARERAGIVDQDEADPAAGLGEPGRPQPVLVGVSSWVTADDGAPGVPRLELKSLYVARAWWGTDLAAVLLDRSLGEAPAHLWVFEANARARRFYEKHGFGPDGVRKVDERTGWWECRYVRTGPTSPQG